MQTMRFSVVAAVCAAVLAFVCAACGESDFNWGKVGHIIEGNPVHLDAEYAMLNGQQLQCGIDNDLWDKPPDLTGALHEQVFARLTDKGRALRFSDDVSVGDMRLPCVQVRGDFNLQAIDIRSDRDGPEKGTKLVDVKLGVRINHPCFPQALYLMGVHKGNFTQDYSPIVLFRFDNGWQLERIMH